MSKTPSVSKQQYRPGMWEWAHDQLLGPPEWDAFNMEYDREVIIETDSGVYGPSEDDRRLLVVAPDMVVLLQDILVAYDEEGAANRDPKIGELAEKIRALLNKIYAA